MIIVAVDVGGQAFVIDINKQMTGNIFQLFTFYPLTAALMSLNLYDLDSLTLLLEIFNWLFI